MAKVPGFLAVLAAAVLPVPSRAQGPEVAPGRLVRVTVQVDGRTAPLYFSPDGSPRRYFEARRGASYSVRLENQSAERLGVVLTVDGLNAISGVLASAQGSGTPGRMYILDPWSDATIQGWRTSLEEVRRFTFVDEKVSYAVRSGQANGKIGWLEVAVYREQSRPVWRLRPLGVEDGAKDGRSSYGGENAPRDQAQSSREAGDSTAKAAPPASGYAGTGWGGRTSDPVEVVSFNPEARPSETVTLRYEYRSALVALGILPAPSGHDRLSERERGDLGFAQPPLW